MKSDEHESFKIKKGEQLINKNIEVLKKENDVPDFFLNTQIKRLENLRNIINWKLNNLLELKKMFEKFVVENDDSSKELICSLPKK